MRQMTFQEENGYTVCYIDGKEVSRAKKSNIGGKEYTAGEGIAISDEGVISLDIADGDEEEF